MGILRIEQVRRNRGLTCTDLFSGERIDIREVLLTHEVAPGNVIGARPFLAADGVWELDGAIYPFTPAQGDAVVAVLRTECSAAREADPTLTEERFLKDRAAAIINRFWFAHVFFPDDEDDYDEEFASADGEEFPDDDDDSLEHDDADVPFPLGWIVDDALPRRSRRPAAAMSEPSNGEAPADFHTDVVSTDPQILELRDFLDSDVAPNAMPIDCLHGFLCAIACGPTNTAPLIWLTHVWGDTPPAFESPAQADQITLSIMNLARSIEQTVSAQSYVPLLPRSITGDRTNIAQGWCAGFEEAIRMDAGGWTPLLEDEEQRIILAPLLIISMPSDVIEDNDGRHAKAVAQSIEILPGMVSAIDDYWNTPRRKPLRAKSVLARRRPSSTGTTPLPADVADTTYDLPTTRR
jgi:uncharacterized protein